MPRNSFLKNRVNGIRYAFRGAMLLIRTEASIQTQIIITLVMTLAGFMFGISNQEWILQILAISLVLGVEGINTAIEKIADFVHPEFDKRIGFIKDISAGAVLFVSIGACLVGLLIYLPKIF